MSVNCLMASPLAKGLFRHAIGESGSLFIPNPFTAMVNLKEDEAEGLKMNHTMNVNSLAELRKIPSAQLLAKSKAFGYLPIIDGYILPASIESIFAAGKQNDADLLTGWNADDGLLLGPARNASGYREMIDKQFGQQAQKFLEFYPATNDSEAASSQLAFSRDMIFGVQDYTWANLQSRSGKGKVFLYHFSRRLPASKEFAHYGAFHGGEIVYALDNLPFLHRPWEEVDHQLATVMSSYWVNFAKTGDPNADGLPQWPAYRSTDKKEILLSEKPASRELPNSPVLDFLADALLKK
jgi:para-nitrobenzyl esterase